MLFIWSMRMWGRRWNGFYDRLRLYSLGVIQNCFLKAVWRLEYCRWNDFLSKLIEIIIHKSILISFSAYAIIAIGKMIKLNSLVTQQKASEVASPRLFYSVLARVAYSPGCGYQLLFSIQPFANVIGDYTCQNRKHKW